MRRCNVGASSSISRTEPQIIRSLKRSGVATATVRTLFYRSRPTISRWPLRGWEEKAFSHYVDQRPQQLPLIVLQTESGSASVSRWVLSCHDFSQAVYGITKM